MSGQSGGSEVLLLEFERVAGVLLSGRHSRQSVHSAHRRDGHLRVQAGTEGECEAAADGAAAVDAEEDTDGLAVAEVLFLFEGAGEVFEGYNVEELSARS